MLVKEIQAVHLFVTKMERPLLLELSVGDLDVRCQTSQVSMQEILLLWVGFRLTWDVDHLLHHQAPHLVPHLLQALHQALVVLPNGKATTIVMMVWKLYLYVWLKIWKYFLNFQIDNNNAGCNWDGGDCCGDDVNTQFCSACECLDPSEQEGCGSPQWQGDNYCDDGKKSFCDFSQQ